MIAAADSPLVAGTKPSPRKSGTVQLVMATCFKGERHEPGEIVNVGAELASELVSANKASYDLTPSALEVPQAPVPMAPEVPGSSSDAPRSADPVIAAIGDDLEALYQRDEHRPLPAQDAPASPETVKPISLKGKK